MSRSRKKTPRAKVCIVRAGEEKKWKRQCSRKIRNTEEVANGGWYRKVTNPWSAPSDGKWWFGKDSKWVRK